MGFSASTGLLTASHNVLGWSFRIGVRAQDLDPSELPSLMKRSKKVVQRKGFATEETTDLGTKIQDLIGVAQALLYLHEECDQRVVHREVKPSNVLIDAELDAKLGDFGLSWIYEHGINPQTTNIVGILGYLAPEFTKTGKATSSTDVYSYGALMLEVSRGRRPIDPQKNAQELVLVDWVRELHSCDQ
ncbi:hypothetical protein F0562_020356 [Nyssa sinensis]|uniref:Protein kinase domain-containing protein n=1 Tax=Nyssa sinensis TaxID=561372 RepID=A0A5J5BVG5_9ASTE|nr:hypothetical protein F0562_020356 [Nyssa sinensis]